MSGAKVDKVAGVVEAVEEAAPRKKASYREAYKLRHGKLSIADEEAPAGADHFALPPLPPGPRRGSVAAPPGAPPALPSAPEGPSGGLLARAEDDPYDPEQYAAARDLEPRLAISFNIWSQTRDAKAPDESQAMPWLNGPPMTAYSRQHNLIGPNETAPFNTHDNFARRKFPPSRKSDETASASGPPSRIGTHLALQNASSVGKSSM